MSEKKISDYLNEFSLLKSLIICGKKSFEYSGAQELIESQVNHYVIYNDFESNPKYNDILKCLNKINLIEFDSIIAIGGGSVIDFAKGLIYYGDSKSIRKFIAIPTTSGTGAEETCFGVVYINNIKSSIQNQKLKPDKIFLIPELTLRLNKQTTLTSSLDCLSQSIEALWSNNANNLSTYYAIKSLELCAKYFEKNIYAPTLKSRKGMQKAANYSGKAINISKTTAPHAFSYGFTSEYGISHGLAVAITLPYFMNYNLNSKNEIREIILKIFNFKKIDVLSNLLKKIINDIFPDFKSICKSIYEDEKSSNLTSKINEERLKNNPTRVSENLYAEIILESLKFYF